MKTSIRQKREIGLRLTLIRYSLITSTFRCNVDLNPDFFRPLHRHTVYPSISENLTSTFLQENITKGHIRVLQEQYVVLYVLFCYAPGTVNLCLAVYPLGFSSPTKSEVSVVTTFAHPHKIPLPAVRT